MAEQKNSMPPRRPGGPGHGPRSHGYQRPQDLRGTVKKLLHYVGRYKGLLVLVAICLLLSSVGSVASSYFLKPAINDYILPGDFAGLLKLLVLMGLVFVLSALCSYVYSRIMVRVSQRTVAALRQDLFDKLQGLPLRYFDTHQSGDLMSRFTNDIDTVSEMINNSFANVLSNSLTFLCTIGMLLYLNWALTLITFAFLGLMLLVVKTIGGRSRVSFQRQQAALGDLNGYIEEMIEGQKVIKVFHHEQQAIDQFSARNDAYQTAATMAQTYAGSMMPATANLSRINYAVTCCIGGLLAMGGVFDIGSLGAYLLYVKQVSQPVSQISQQVNTILAAMAGAERIFAVMEAQPEEDEGQTTIVRVEKNGDTLTEVPQRTGHWAWKKPDGSLTELRGDVRFDHVTFGYDPDKVVLHDISLFAEPGQKIAFVGSTGAGKTTSPTSSTASTTSSREPSPTTASTSGRSARTLCGSRWASSCRIPTSSPAPLPTTSATASWTPRMNRSGPPPSWLTPTPSSATCLRVTTPSSPVTAAVSVRGSASCWPLHGPPCPILRC